MALIRMILVRTPLPTGIIIMLGLGVLLASLLTALIYKVRRLERELQTENDKEQEK